MPSGRTWFLLLIFGLLLLLVWWLLRSSRRAATPALAGSASGLGTGAADQSWSPALSESTSPEPEADLNLPGMPALAVGGAASGGADVTGAAGWVTSRRDVTDEEGDGDAPSAETEPLAVDENRPESPASDGESSIAGDLATPSSDEGAWPTETSSAHGDTPGPDSKAPDDDASGPDTDLPDDEVSGPATDLPDDEVSGPATDLPDDDVSGPDTDPPDDDVSGPATDLPDDDVSGPATDLRDEDALDIDDLPVDTDLPDFDAPRADEAGLDTPSMADDVAAADASGRASTDTVWDAESSAREDLIDAEAAAGGSPPDGGSAAWAVSEGASEATASPEVRALDGGDVAERESGLPHANVPGSTTAQEPNVHRGVDGDPGEAAGITAAAAGGMAGAAGLGARWAGMGAESDVPEDTPHFDLSGLPGDARDVPDASGGVGADSDVAGVEEPAAGPGVGLDAAEMAHPSALRDSHVGDDEPEAPAQAYAGEATGDGLVAGETAAAVEGSSSDGDEGAVPHDHAVVDGGWSVGSAKPNDDGCMPLGHPIKGVFALGIYQVPGSDWYDDTVPDVWFTDEGAAQTAGFTRGEG